MDIKIWVHCMYVLYILFIIDMKNCLTVGQLPIL